MYVGSVLSCQVIPCVELAHEECSRYPTTVVAWRKHTTFAMQEWCKASRHVHVYLQISEPARALSLPWQLLLHHHAEHAVLKTLADVKAQQQLLMQLSRLSAERISREGGR